MHYHVVLCLATLSAFLAARKKTQTRCKSANSERKVALTMTHCARLQMESAGIYDMKLSSMKTS
eukprot:6486716-Amphidinium_carterae.1